MRRAGSSARWNQVARRTAGHGKGARDVDARVSRAGVLTGVKISTIAAMVQCWCNCMLQCSMMWNVKGMARVIWRSVRWVGGCTRMMIKLQDLYCYFLQAFAVRYRGWNDCHKQPGSMAWLPRATGRF